ncbi:MAG TPA: pilus assembly protein N-terminal domain-containing protein [Polyangiaceae bacterium]|nr:pilus assembly protein N-terminal domain-containing protein [Polyangiaceae bacterium]
MLLSATPVARAQPTAIAQSASSAPVSSEQSTAITLSVGEQQVLSTDQVKSYSEGVRGIVDVRLTRDGGQFVLVGLKPGQTSLLFLMENHEQHHYDITVTQHEDPSINPELGPVHARDNIRLDFYFVQLDKSYNHQIGVGWPGAIGPASMGASLNLQTARFDSATAVITDQPLPRLDMAQANGWAKLMRQAAVVTANGTKATFSGGGEVNIAVQSSLATGIHSIEFGSTIDVLPRYDSKNGRIELQVHAEVSDLTDDHGTGTPGRTRSTLDTIVNLELGQSLVLAGLTASSEAHSQTGLPFLSTLPFIGGLFGSNGAHRQDSENIVLIVPSVVDATTQSARARVRQALEAYTHYDGELKDMRLHATVDLTNSWRARP